MNLTVMMTKRAYVWYDKVYMSILRAIWVFYSNAYYSSFHYLYIISRSPTASPRSRISRLRAWCSEAVR